MCKKSSNQTELKCCGNCKKVYYCSVKCQKEGWNGHKNKCKQIKDF